MQPPEWVDDSHLLFFYFTTLILQPPKNNYLQKNCDCVSSLFHKTILLITRKESLIAFMAIIMPILPGKKEMWQKLMDQKTVEPGRTEFVKSRDEAGVRERSFLQEGPDGDFVILTFEGKILRIAG